MTIELAWMLTKLLVFVSLTQCAIEYMFLAKERMTRLFLGAGFLLSAMILINPMSEFLSIVPVILLLVNTYYWRRPFNGGSDQMLFILLFSIFLRDSFLLESPERQFAVNIFIAGVCMLSYFRSGWVKLKNDNWRSGQLLIWAQQQSCFDNNKINSLSAKRLSALVLAFETLFPLTLFNSTIATSFIACGIFFHFSIVWMMGLNRFPWVWMACYPSIFFCSQQFDII